ncbi:MAG: HD domain-containing protein [Tissierellia bacterium]|nr:HD domain-containing protein [Tissierellia bacterium]
MPIHIEELLNRLEKNGYEAYLVGGCVRDFIRGIEPNDYDIATNAKAIETESVFSDYRTVDIGSEYGTIVVVTQYGNVEITSYRYDGEYDDRRHPSKVEFVNNIEEDLGRRDFTINAMAMDLRGNIVDPYGGKIDLSRGLIQTVGDSAKRFEEDKLRILRAIRFATQFDFDLEPKTMGNINKYANSINVVSYERIRDEFSKILLSKTPSRGLHLLQETGILNELIPELIPTVDFDQKTPYHNKTLFDHILCVVDNVKPKLHLRLAALFHDIEKPNTLTIDESGKGHFYGHDILGGETAEKIMRRLRYDNITINAVKVLIEQHMKAHDVMTKKAVKRQMNRVGEEYIYDLLNLMIADRICTSEDRDIDFLLERIGIVDEILNNSEIYKKNQIAINGNDIKDLGFSEGVIIGEILDFLYELVLENKDLNDRDKLIELIEKNYK